MGFACRSLPDLVAEIVSALRKLLPGLGLVLFAYKLGDWWADETGAVPAFLPLLAALLYLHFLREVSP